jgi:hypothetical protein
MTFFVNPGTSGAFSHPTASITSPVLDAILTPMVVAQYPNWSHGRQ